MHYPVNVQERRELLAECGQLLRQVQRVKGGSVAQMAGTSPGGTDALLQKAASLKTLYRNHLPVLPLSRCPFTGQVMYRSIDPYGIDGYWWDYHNPVRSLTFLPSTFFSFTGAMQLVQPVEETDFLCCAGPGVPFVIPHLLTTEKIKAVLYSLKIGPHTGYPVVYFADPAPQGIEPVNDWGTDHWKYLDFSGGIHWNESFDDEEEYDFDLVPYLRSGRLLWINPDDRTMSLCSGLAGCPYADLKGERRTQRIQYGKVWTT